MSAAILNAVRSALAGCTERDTLLAAVSGGADSTALLATLVMLREECRWNLRCVHVQHNLRGEESIGDEHFVVELCGRFEVPCVVAAIPPGAIERGAREKGRGLEAAAREHRHALLRAEARRCGAKAVLIAHTRDDMLENVLIRILRGAGPAGLAALPERRGIIRRPLINVRRAELRVFLDAQRIAFRSDSSNNDERFLRNRIRARLVPALDAAFPTWTANLARFAETQTLVAAYLKKRVRCALRSHAGEEPSAVRVRDFFRLPEILREELVFNAADKLARKSARAEFFAGEKPAPPPRRSVVRRFSRGALDNATTGDVVLHAEGGDALIRPRRPPLWDEGFSLTIAGDGIYHAGSWTLECAAAPDGRLRLSARRRFN